VVGGADGFLAGAAIDFDAEADFFVIAGVGPAGVGGAKEGDQGCGECGGDVAGAGVVGDDDGCSFDEFLDGAEGEVLVVEGFQGDG